MKAFNKKRKPKHTTKMKIVLKSVIGFGWIDKKSFNTKRKSISIYYKQSDCMEQYTVKYRYAEPIYGYDFKFKKTTKYD